MPPKRLKTVAATAAVAADSMDALYFRHYTEQVAKHGAQTAILLQVGKFFEMYDSVDVATGCARANVQQIAELCGSCVEPKPTADPTRRRLFWGFPEMSLAKFERLLVAAGYTVVVVVQNKDATGDVTSRTVDHIASPGTFWDAEGGLAVRRNEQVLLGVYVEPYDYNALRQPHWYLATTAFDVMTGRCVSTETDITVIDGKPVLDAVQPFWSVYPPAEVIVWWCSTTAAPPTEAAIAAMFPSTAGGRRVPIHIRVRDPKEDGAKAAATLRTDFLTAIYKPAASLTIHEYLGIEMYPFLPRSLAGLLEFVRDHNPSYLTALHDHQVWTPEDNVLLGNAALEQLAMIPVNSDKFSESLLYWLQRSITAMGRRALRERLLKPIAALKELNARQDRIAALRAPIVRAALEPHLRGMLDLPRLFRRFQLGTGGTDELLQVLTTYEKAAQLFSAARGTVYEPQNIAELLGHCGSLAEIWCVERVRAARAQVGDAVAVGSVHPWRRGVHADLDALEDRWKALETQMLAVRTGWEALLEETDAITWSLKDDAPFTFTTTQRRATMLATAAKRRGQPEITLIKRGTSSVVTLETAATIAASASARSVRAEWRAEVERHWRADWSTWMATAIEEGLLEAQVEAIAQLDAECALAAVSEEFGYVRPVYLESSDASPAGVRLRGLRHPIIERINTATPYISHNLALGSVPPNASDGVDEAASPGTILLYGVNAAGKSSLGKAIGLAVLMAQAGMPVPATAMTLIPYTAVFTRILGNDNLWAGMSSFVVEMTEFRSILRSAGSRTLVIGDELCAGTETASATAIVAAGLQTLSARKTHSFFATHLHELATIPELVANTAIRAYHLTVHPDMSTGHLVYDRKLREGCGSPMYGLEVCRGLDMDTDFLRLAFDLRKRMFEPADAHLSSYNPAVVVRACEICHKTGDGLETHHIVPQAAASPGGMIAAGIHKNTAANLAVLCETCHRDHHAGLLEIIGWVATTGGRQLSTRRR